MSDGSDTPPGWDTTDNSSEAPVFSSFNIGGAKLTAESSSSLLIVSKDNFSPVIFVVLVLLIWGCQDGKLTFAGGFLANVWWCLVRSTCKNANKSGGNGASLFTRLTLIFSAL